MVNMSSIDYNICVLKYNAGKQCDNIMYTCTHEWIN